MRVRVVGALTIATGALLALAAPAGAATAVIANDKYKWFYWLSFLFAAMFVLAVIGLSIGYAVKVLLPKYRGKRVEE